MKPIKDTWREVVIVPKSAVMIEIIVTGKKRVFRTQQKSYYNWTTHENEVKIELTTEKPRSNP